MRLFSESAVCRVWVREGEPDAVGKLLLQSINVRQKVKGKGKGIKNFFNYFEKNLDFLENGLSLQSHSAL